ncbi:unnamed protein product [Brachionus calyciflorus]|uniref:Uncharacterized protein n=1 Tax=Brachionus calyciflorus TaxID=104777 RepID=A0A814G5K8_9BILA|nr:unnamed protein product [Brachionus calyciflorus]
MIFRTLIFCMVFWITHCIVQELDLYKNNIDFERPDFNFNITMDDSTTHFIEGYKSLENDVIIRHKLNRDYKILNAKLKWAVLRVSQYVSFKKDMLRMDTNGFDILNRSIENDFNSHIFDLIQKKYKYKIGKNNLIPLYPSKIECKAKFQSIQITGRVEDTDRNDIRIFFYAPEKSYKRLLFENEVNKTNSNFKIDCDYSWNTGKVLSDKMFTLTSKQIQDLNIIEKLFGKSEHVYVTRNQIGELSKEVYENLNIFDDYEITIDRFEKIFVDSFVGNKTFTLVEYDQVIPKLSTYNVKEALKSNELKSEMSKIFRVYQKTEEIELNKNEYTNFYKKYEKSKGSVFGCLDSLVRLEKVLFEMPINQDEYYYENECKKSSIEWSKIGNVIVPKRIRVAKIDRSSLKESLNFNDVIQFNKKTYYKRRFTLFNKFNKL